MTSSQILITDSLEPMQLSLPFPKKGIQVPWPVHPPVVIAKPANQVMLGRKV